MFEILMEPLMLSIISGELWLSWMLGIIPSIIFVSAAAARFWQTHDFSEYKTPSTTTISTDPKHACTIKTPHLHVAPHTPS